MLTPQESALARRRWGFDGAPNFEDHAWHPRVAAPLAPVDEVILATARQKLFAAREQRIRPGRDDKILTSWNALMIQGVARAARVFARPDWLAGAQAATDFLRTTHWRDGQLLATSKDGKAHLTAYLDDYAFLLAALLELMQAEFRSADLAFSTQLADALLDRFEDSTAAGGFYFTAHDHEALIQRPKTGHDNATPSGNGIAAQALQRLGHLLGEPRYLAAAERCLKLYWAGMQRSPGGYASLLTALDEFLQPPAIAILRGPATEIGGWVARLTPHPRQIVLALPNHIAPEVSLSPTLLKPESDHVNAWVCRGVTCLPPIAEFDALLLALRAN